MIVFVFYLSHCWGECATVGEVGQTVNLLPSGWVGSNPTTPTTISAKVKCFGKEYARLWRWAYLVCRYSTTVSASACHAEDVSSILITCSSFRLSTSDVKGMWLLRACRNRLALTTLWVLRLVSVNCPVCLWDYSFDRIVKRTEPSNRWIREWMLYCAWTMWMYKGNSLLWADSDNGEHFCFARRESGFDSQSVHRISLKFVSR